MQGDLSIVTELQRGINVMGRACRTLKRKRKINKDDYNYHQRNCQAKNREIGEETLTVNDAPSVEEVEDFWKYIWSEEK